MNFSFYLPINFFNNSGISPGFWLRAHQPFRKQVSFLLQSRYAWNNSTGMSHTFAGRCRLSGNKGNNGFVICSLINCAARSSASPPISPINSDGFDFRVLLKELHKSLIIIIRLQDHPLCLHRCSGQGRSGELVDHFIGKGSAAAYSSDISFQEYVSR